MARKKIREYDSKRLLKQHIKALADLDLPLKAAQVGRGACCGRTHELVLRHVAARSEAWFPSDKKGSAGRFGALKTLTLTMHRSVARSASCCHSTTRRKPTPCDSKTNDSNLDNIPTGEPKHGLF